MGYLVVVEQKSEEVEQLVEEEQKLEDVEQ